MTQWSGNERRKLLLTDDDKKFFINHIFPQEKKYFGFKVQELAIIFSILIGVFGFYLRTNDTLSRLVILGEKTQTFMDNSDNYHSVISGFSFKQGQPANIGYITKVDNGGKLN